MDRDQFLAYCRLHGGTTGWAGCLAREIGRIVRSFDPCLTCGTHHVILKPVESRKS